MKLNKTVLPILNCHSDCPKCKSSAQFRLFESGAGGDFQTYLGEKTGNLYRIDIGMNYYLKVPLEELIRPIVEAEEGEEFIRKIPDNLKCNICGIEFNGSPAKIDSEEKIEVFEVIK